MFHSGMLFLLPHRFLCLHGFFSGAAAIEEQQAAGLLVQVTLAGKEHSNGNAARFTLK